MVGDADRAAEFYGRLFGFEEVGREFGGQAIFLRARGGDNHDDLAPSRSGRATTDAAEGPAHVVVATEGPRALIFDAFVAGWLEREVGLRIDAVQWSVTTYPRYLSAMHEWADALGIAPDELEMCIFRDEAARRPGNQWGGGSPPASRPRVEPAPGTLPFDAYPQGGRVLLGKPREGDRHGSPELRSQGARVVRPPLRLLRPRHVDLRGSPMRHLRWKTRVEEGPPARWCAGSADAVASQRLRQDT